MMGSWFGRLFGRQLVSSPPPMPEGMLVPSEEDLRWARRQTEALIRKAHELDIEVDLDRLERASR